MALACDDNMVDQRDTDEDPGLHKLQRKLAVRLTWATVAAWVVVYDESAGQAFAQERSEDIRKTDMNAIDLTQRYDVPGSNAIANI